MTKYGPENPDATYVTHEYPEAGFDTGEVTLNYATTGSSDKPALLLIPAQSNSWWSYEPVMKLLADDFEVFAVDLRGQGRSTRTPGRYTLDNMGNDLVRFISGRIRRPVIVSGASSGGLVTAWLSAYASPGLIRAAYYEDAPLFAAETRPAYGQGISQGIGPMHRLMSTYLGDQWSIGDYRGLVRAMPTSLPPAMLAGLAAMSGHNDSADPMSNVDKRETTTPLSIAVLGVGRIGSTFAYKLAAAGHDVTVVTRPGSERLRQLQRDHGIRLKSGGRSDVRIADALDENIAYDLVLVTTLDHQVDALLPTLQRSEARCIQFMFVTFNAERFADAIGDERCRFGMPAVTASLDAEGKLDAAVPRQKTLHSDQRWVDLFNRAGMPSELERNMPLWLRCHVPLTVAMESVSVAGRQRGGGTSWAEAKTVARGLAGGFAVIRDLGDRLYPRSKSWLNSAPTFVVTFMLWAVSHIASFRELLADGAPEARALVDTMAAAGAGTKLALAPAVRDLLAMRPAADPA